MKTDVIIIRKKWFTYYINYPDGTVGVAKSKKEALEICSRDGYDSPEYFDAWRYFL